ncbi:MAG TPA: glycosyltransferase, partial [Puia sp.]|nr:glycosyltransferase [Puia sp.]
MLFFLTGIACVLFVAYAVLIFFYQRRWAAIPYFLPGGAELAPAGSGATAELPGSRATGALEPAGSRATRITVLIPARNEASGILDCLRSLARQTYPKDRFEVIVLDDHSTDGTAAVVEDFVASGAEGLALRCLRIAEVPLPSGLTAYKKFAIGTGVGAAAGELIVTTDADCSFDPQWLSTLAAFYEEKGARFIAAPVRIEPAPRPVEHAMHSPVPATQPTTGHAPHPTEHATRGALSLLGIFQTLDFITLQGITGAAVHSGLHSMCNGANLAYTRQAFYEVQGFKGIDHIPSGDDMLLMHKIY